MGNRMETTNKKLTAASGFLKQGSILAVASILVRMIGLLYRIPMANIIGSEGNGICLRDIQYIADHFILWYADGGIQDGIGQMCRKTV